MDKKIYKRFNIKEVNSRAASMAYYLLLSLFPFLIFMINIIGYIPNIHINKYITLMSKFIPNNSFVIIQSILNSAIENKSISLMIFSFFFTLWTSSRAIRVFVNGANTAYRKKETRSFLKIMFMSFYFTFELIILILSSMIFLVYGEKIGHFVFNLIGLKKIFISIWNSIRYVVGIFITIFILSSLCCYAPNKKLKFKEAMPGAITSICGWVLSSLVFSYYTNNFANYQIIYGGLGGIIALLTWLYLTSWLMLIGNEINAMIYFRKIKKI